VFGTAGLLVGLAVGAALLALWCHVRWPGAAPGTLMGAVLRVAVGFALLQAGIVVLDRVVGTSLGVALLALVGVVLPILTFAFLTSLWVMKVFADALKGHF
jgi:hypothetical protein